MRRSSFKKLNNETESIDISLSRDISSQYDNVKIVADDIDNVVTVAESIELLQAVQDSLEDLAPITTQIVPNIAEILQADDNATTATAMAITATTQADLANAARVVAETKATEAGLSAIAADASADSAEASATTATTQATIATTKANEASASATSASNSATTATNQATIATTKASEASASEASALSSKNASALSETNAKTSETNAALSEANALAYKNSASDSATTATTQAGIATDQATIATTQAGIATTQANTATTKAAEASASAIAAYNSELAAAAMLDAFDDRYLGSFVVDPITDNDGQPLLDGALYFNTSANVLKVYDVGTTTWYTIPQTLLSSLLDVQLTSTTVGDMLSWNGAKWVNTSSVQEHITDMNNPHSVTKSQVGLGNVDNTSDANKPVSTATQTALNLKANLVSPALTGTPLAPTASTSTNTTQIATTAFVQAQKVNTVLTGIPTTPTAVVGTNTTQIASTAYVKAEISNETYSKTQLNAGQLDNRYYTETELNSGVLDTRYYTEAETDSALSLKAPLASPALTGIPTGPTAAVGTSTTQLATTAFVKAEVASEAYSKAELDAGQLDNRYFTETELLNGALDVRYYTESEIDAKLDAQNDAGEIAVIPSGNLVSTNVQDALVELQGDIDNRYIKAEIDTLLAGKVDDSEIASVNLLRADKYLAAQNVVNMSYNLNGKLEKVQYNNATDVDYEVLTYNVDGKLSNVAHYVGGVLQGNTVLSYSNGKLVSAPYTAI